MIFFENRSKDDMLARQMSHHSQKQQSSQAMEEK